MPPFGLGAVRAAAALLVLLSPLAGLGVTSAQERTGGAVAADPPPAPPRGSAAGSPAAPSATVPREGAVEIAGVGLVTVEEMPRGMRLSVQEDVLFDADSVELRPDAEAALRRIAGIIRDRHPRSVRIIGHAGHDDRGRVLSERRAQTVRQWLATEGGGGVSPAMHAGGHAGSVAAQPNEPGAREMPEGGGQQNRRVQVLLER